DDKRFGTPDWNPLGEFLRPGERVLIKPNFIKESHPRDPDGWKYTVTHGSIIRAVADYIWKALDGRGQVIVADAPQTDSSFTEIVRILGVDHIRSFYQQQGLDFQLFDLRKQEWTRRDGVVVRRRPLPGDPNGAAAFDLGTLSAFAG